MSDNELDAELLELAGDLDDAGDDAIGSPDGSIGPRSPTPLDDAIEDKSPPPSQPRRGVAQKRKTSGARGAARKRLTDDSEDEGEASSPAPSHDSLGSGAMSESDSGEDIDADGDLDDDDAPLFPIEGKFISDRDRDEIMAMPEARREMILAERQEQALKRKQDAHLALLLKRQQQEDAKKAERKKRKAGAADLEDGPRKTSRARTKHNDAVDAFKRKREQDLKERELGASRRRRPSPTGKGSDIDAEGESDVEWADERQAREDQPPDLRDFQRVRVGRSNFAQVCFYPEFEDTITGCYTRACVGANPETGRSEYRMAQIKAFETGKPYQIEGASGRIFWVDQYVRLAYGRLEKTWPFTACSDSEFTEQEFNRYRIIMENEGVRMPTKALLARTLDGIHSLLNRKWTDADIAEKIKKQNKLAHFNAGGAATAVTAAAASNGVVYSAEKKQTEADRLHQLNIQNRKKNAEEVRKALIAEKRAAAAARQKAKEREEAHKAAAAAKASLQVPGDGHDDLFGSDISRAGTPGLGSGVGTPQRSSTPLGVKKEKKVGLPTFKKKVMDDEIMGSMDLGIEIDI